MKHAFPDGETGYIKLELYQKSQKIVLKVIDNGIGFPEDLDYKKTSSLGLQLVNNLTKQIDGEFELDRNQGTSFALIFEEKE
jgi:two-component sensor histidine kinase